ncbi:GDP-L-fucose synthase [Acidimicrobiia bacterium]|jgi:GDP-L-fucose synthase|nr:GDP-L-fucose synthase [Acidimicrobiia bacterium]
MRILVFGSTGLVGSSTVKALIKNDKYTKVFGSTRKDTNLFSFDDTHETIKDFRPDVIVNAAAKVGGILANNTDRFEFITENLKINMNILESLKHFKDIKLVNLGSSCIYPLDAPNPIKEEYIMDGKLEPTNSPYAMAKLAAIEMGDALEKQFDSKIVNLMPTNLYGPNDNFSENESHVIPGLISRMHKAKLSQEPVFNIWGTGKPKREFLYVDDLAEAINFVIKNDVNTKLLNVGSNEEVTIKELSIIIKEALNFEGSLEFDETKPDGNPRKLLDSTKIFELGWKPLVSLTQGIERTYSWFNENIS